MSELAWVRLFLFVAGGALAPSTRLGAAERGSGARAECAFCCAMPSAQDTSPGPAQGAAPIAAPGRQPATVSAPDDPALAGRYAGRVIGPDGKPVVGARVFIAPNDPKLKAPGPVRALTDADGRFEFDAPDMTFTELDGIPARRQGLLIATADGYAPDWMLTSGRNPVSRSVGYPVKMADLTLQLAKNDVTIHGRFLDPQGRPLAGARVRLVELMVPMKRDLGAHLARESQLLIFAGTDYDQALNRPDLLPGVTTEALTDATGRFTMSGLGRDRLAVVSVSAPTVVDTRLTVMTRLAHDVDTRPDLNGNPTQAIYGAGFILQLKPGRTVKGIVRDAHTHQGIAGMWVGPGGDPMRGFSEGEYRWTTDKDGRFTITGLDPSAPRQEITAVPRPGRPYLIAARVVDDKSETVIECLRGIPFRLRVTDEEGRPVKAEVTYHVVLPSAHVPETRNVGYNGAINYAARSADGTYESFVLPGPGAVLVKVPADFDYRPAHVDPKAFFAPGRSDWTKQELISTYGNHDTLSIHPGWWLDQHEYAAIVLVNPRVNSEPLELSATVVKDKPRRVTLIDLEGKPVVGADTEGMTWFPWDNEPRLRTGTFSVTKLHPDWGRRITYFKEDRKLIAFLMARGDSEAAYTVRMQPWGTVTGRLVDLNGKALPLKQAALPGRIPAALYMGNWRATVTNSDPNVGEHPGVQTDLDGRFRLDKLVPGLRYSAEVYLERGGFAGMAFEDLVVGPGEVRDLGDTRTKPPVGVRNQ